jgi:hypothetical protein
MATKGATKQTVDQGYGRTSRRYTIPGSDAAYDSVTSILSVIGKPALINWAANTERTLVTEAAADLYEDLPLNAPKMARPSYIATLAARLGKLKAHQKELTKASEIGSRVHALIEWTLRKEKGELVGEMPVLVDKALWAFMVWEEWRKATTLKPLAIEQTVWSHQHHYAGTMDLLADITIPAGPVQAVLDWKSGKAIYEEAILQNAAYIQALIEMGHVKAPVWGVIVRVPKVETDPDPEIRIITPAEQREAFAAFLHAKALWDWQQASTETNRKGATRAANPDPEAGAPATPQDRAAVASDLPPLGGDAA